MRGYLLLTEARSGSNWLGSLVNSAGTMGKSSEWLAPKVHQLETGVLSWDAFFQEVLKKCSTPNGTFGSKIFPNQLFLTHEVYGRDFIQECLAAHDVALVLLRREDTLRQAISFARARQTRRFAVHVEEKADPRYDFDQIARCYFYIRDSYAFWQSYLELSGTPFTEFVYEELAADPSPFVNHLVAHMQVAPPAELTTSMAVQRDELTEQWIARFNEDRRSANLLTAYDRREHIPGKMKNFFRLGTRSLQPRHPFAF